MYPARVDDKGRLKLPATFQQYFEALDEKALFVTSLDRRTAQIYRMSQWLKTEKELEAHRENPQSARNLLFTAAELGSETAMDPQGRILFSPELRRALHVENAPVKMYANRGRIDVLADSDAGERSRRAAENAAADIDALEVAGIV
jgi:MraZ protein